MGQIGRHRLRQRLATTALAVGVGVAAAACSSASAARPVSLHTPSGAAAATTSPGDPARGTGPTPATASAGSPQTSPGATTTTPPTAHSPAPAAATQPAATTPPSQPAATGPALTTPAGTGPAPAAAGTYTYAGGGSTTLTANGKVTTLAASPATTLVVSAGSGGPGSEQWNNASTITSNLLFNSSGVFLTSETVSLAGSSTTCTFGSPVPMPPWPVAVGKSFSGQATCGSGSSTGVFSLVGQVQASAGRPVGGTTVAAFQVHSTLTMTGLSVDETDWYAPSLRLPVASTFVIRGSSGSSSVTSNATYVLTSPVPS